MKKIGFVITLALTVICVCSCKIEQKESNAENFEIEIQRQVKRGDAALRLEKHWDDTSYMVMYEITGVKCDVDNSRQCDLFSSIGDDYFYGGWREKVIPWLYAANKGFYNNPNVIIESDSVPIVPPLDYTVESWYAYGQKKYGIERPPFYFIRFHCNEAQREEGRQMIMDFFGFSHRSEVKCLPHYRLTLADEQKMASYRDKSTDNGNCSAAYSDKIEIEHATLRDIADILQDETSKWFLASDIDSIARYTLSLDIKGKEMTEIISYLREHFGIKTDTVMADEEIHYFEALPGRIETSQKSTQSEITNLTMDEYEKMDKKGIVVIDFSASWCEPCQQQTINLKAVAPQHKEVRFYMVDVDKEKTLARQYAVGGVPMLVILKDGKLAKKLTGLQSQEAISAAIKEAE